MLKETKFICPKCSAEITASDIVKYQLEENKIMGMPLIVPEELNKLKVSNAIKYANEMYNEAIQTVTSTASSNIHRALAVLKIVMELQEFKDNNTGK